jgi:hypothetical protein
LNIYLSKNFNLINFLLINIFIKYIYLMATSNHWFTVRQTRHSGGRWHQATDDLKGTDVYTYNDVPEFSKNFESEVPGYTHFLFALLNQDQNKPGTEWAVMTKQEINRPYSDSFDLGGNRGMIRDVVASSQNSQPHTVIMESGGPTITVTEWHAGDDGVNPVGPAYNQHVIYAEGGAGPGLPSEWLHPYGAVVYVAKVTGTPDWENQGYDAIYSSWNPEGTTSK